MEELNFKNLLNFVKVIKLYVLKLYIVTMYTVKLRLKIVNRANNIVQ